MKFTVRLRPVDGECERIAGNYRRKRKSGAIGTRAIVDAECTARHSNAKPFFRTIYQHRGWQRRQYYKRFDLGPSMTSLPINRTPSTATGKR